RRARAKRPCQRILVSRSRHGVDGVPPPFFCGDRALVRECAAMATPAHQHIARYRVGGAVHHGRREAGGFARLSAPPWLGGREVGAHDADAGVTLLAPVSPTKIVCVGLNYRAHIAESASVVPGAAPPQEPLIFLKPASAVVATGEAIRYPHGVTRLDPEAELGLVIGRRAR